MWNLIFYKTFICIYLAPLGLGCGMQGVWCYIQSLICGLWDLVPRPGIEPGPPALGARGLNCWTTREVLNLIFEWTEFALRIDWEFTCQGPWSGSEGIYVAKSGLNPLPGPWIQKEGLLGFDQRDGRSWTDGMCPRESAHVLGARCWVCVIPMQWWWGLLRLQSLLSFTFLGLPSCGWGLGSQGGAKGWLFLWMEQDTRVSGQLACAHGGGGTGRTCGQRWGWPRAAVFMSSLPAITPAELSGGIPPADLAFLGTWRYIYQRGSIE